MVVLRMDADVVWSFWQQLANQIQSIRRAPMPNEGVEHTPAEFKQGQKIAVIPSEHLEKQGLIYAQWGI